MKKNHNPYIEHIMNEVGYVFSIIDREISSKTYGCADRTYWCWKFTDFPGARFQEILYTLTWLYTYNSDNNKYYKNKILFEYIQAGFNYWTKIQNPNGSYNEAYPNENSLAATAFTLFYITESFFLVQDNISADTKLNLIKSIDKASYWLCKNDETHGFLSNHLAAASAGLYNSFLVINKKEYKSRYKYFLQKIISNQSEEGWYLEYGGADPGYQTHCSFYLAVLFKKTNDLELLDSLKKANEYLSYFIHPDGSIGGEYASRNTSFFFPAAYEILKDECDYSCAISQNQRISINNKNSIGIWQMDSFNFFPILNNYIFASNAYEIKANRYSKVILPYLQKPFEQYFSHCGIFIKSTKFYYAIVGGKKGGVIVVYNKKDKCCHYQSSGYIDKLGNNYISSQSQGISDAQLINQSFSVKTPFSIINQKTFNPLLFIFFRLYNMTFSRMKSLSYLLKNLLVNKLVNKTKKLPINLKRTFLFKSDSILVKDVVDGKITNNFKHIHKFTSFHMGSSRYASFNEIIDKEKFDNNINNVNDEIIHSGEITFEKN